MATAILKSMRGYDLVYDVVDGRGPTVVFLPGFMSDRNGTKALFLEGVMRAQGQKYIRLDYSGHGDSGGNFLEGSIGRWTEDALEILEAAAPPPWVIIGSSMGGWIMLNIARRHPEKVKALIGIAAAPDFTVKIEKKLEPRHHHQLKTLGYVEDDPQPDYPNPLRFSKALFEDGRNHLHLTGPIPLTAPVRLLQGMRDEDVPWQTALEISERLQSDDVQIHLVKDGDHSLSRPQDLDFLKSLALALLD